MKQKESRLRNINRQRQRSTSKMIIILGTSISLIILLVIVFHISHVDESKAALMDVTSKNIVIVPDEVNATEFSINKSLVARTAPVVSNPQFGHVAKPISYK